MQRPILAFFISAVVSGSGAFAASIDATVATASGEAIEHAVVWIDLASPPGSTSPSRAIVNQINQQFVPYVTPVEVGTTVDFPNNDPFRHHVYSFSPAKTFELKLYGGGETQSVTFDKPGPVALGCNIHDNMLAYVFVTPGPFFAVTDGAGRARIDGAPQVNTPFAPGLQTKDLMRLRQSLRSAKAPRRRPILSSRSDPTVAGGVAAPTTNAAIEGIGDRRVQHFPSAIDGLFRRAVCRRANDCLFCYTRRHHRQHHRARQTSIGARARLFQS